ncbi:RNA polymerase sigma factor [Spirosoma montaniterrae]|uniref:RNA polymerase subunit sigma-24 n=1 Tax=Spirosoma montaniterrae TaxID=1178516 RepID=A0A1P9WUN9_9BACT|nr:sigma-70 family RNA polymerase sigma factor [Spirosoma montaniterrae]AQG79058.1 hypothetical protein AWR27_06805 [Spirosoma montaniterrae]
MPQPFTDEQLWQQLRDGHEGAFAELMRRYHSPLVSYARKLTPDTARIDDAVQELFVELWTKRQSLGPTTAVRPYLLASLRRRLVRTLNRDRWLQFTGTDALDLPFLAQFSVEERLIDDETQQQQLRRLNYLINTLPARQREALYLKFYQNLNNEQIAGVMHIGYQPATNLIYRALTYLRQHWHEEFNPLLLLVFFS